MKNVLKYGFLVIAIFFISGCSSLDAESFNDIGKGMTEQEVIDVLGKPAKKITKQTEVSELVDSNLKTVSSILALTDENEYPDEYEKFYSQALEIAEAKALIEQGDSVIAYQYKYKRNDSDGKKVTSERELFFSDGKLIAD